MDPAVITKQCVDCSFRPKVVSTRGLAVVSCSRTVTIISEVGRESEHREESRMASTSHMKALHYDGPFKTIVKEIPTPSIQHPDDIIVKVTTACICGSDLHMYQGRTAAQPGIVFGHENMGIVSEAGAGVSNLNKGDRVVMPFNVPCGRCVNCEEGKTAFCTGVNPGFAGG